MRMERMSRIAEQRHSISYPRVDFDEAGGEIGDSRPCLHRSKTFGQFRSSLSDLFFETSQSFLLQVFKAASSNGVEDGDSLWASWHYPNPLPRRFGLSRPILQVRNRPD